MLPLTPTHNWIVYYTVDYVFCSLRLTRPGRTRLLALRSVCLYILTLSFISAEYIFCRNDPFVLAVLIFTLWLWWDNPLWHAPNKHAQRLPFCLSQRRFLSISSALEEMHALTRYPLSWTIWLRFELNFPRNASLAGIEPSWRQPELD